MFTFENHVGLALFYAYLTIGALVALTYIHHNEEDSFSLDPRSGTRNLVILVFCLLLWPALLGASSGVDDK